MIDDILAISECSTSSLKMNSMIEAKILTKNLKLGHDKCSVMHVGKKASKFKH